MLPIVLLSVTIMPILLQMFCLFSRWRLSPISSCGSQHTDTKTDQLHERVQFFSDSSLAASTMAAYTIGWSTYSKFVTLLAYGCLHNQIVHLQQVCDSIVLGLPTGWIVHLQKVCNFTGLGLLPTQPDGPLTACLWHYKPRVAYTTGLSTYSKFVTLLS